MRLFFIIIATLFLQFNCKKNNNPEQPPVTVSRQLVIENILLDNTSFGTIIYGTTIQPVIKVKFNEPVLQSTIGSSVELRDAVGTVTSVNINWQSTDSSLVIQPNAPLNHLSKYFFAISTTLKSASGGNLTTAVNNPFITRIDSSNKFPVISDNALLDLVQQQTFKYFWDYGHPVSGLARERSNSTPETITSGGSGFGIMSIPVGINRNFITRAQGLVRMQTIVAFLKNTAVKVKGAFPHWLNGTTGAIIPFSSNDNGADLVETSYLMMGLLTARQYFNGTDPGETALRNDINTLYNNVEWDWFRQGGQNVLYWHYSTDKGWIMNHQVKGWNECLITYILAAASTTHGIPRTVYTNGWATGNGFINGSSYYGYPLPLGPAQGGPLFFEHYTFMGVNPNGLTDVYANYTTQTKNHTLINYEYCKANPKNNFGYSDAVWGLTASDIQNGYTASSPTNDVSVIAPTAALSSFPYTPTESMKALKFFYYILGDKLFKQYGFVDAFSLKELWYANSFLAIDQGPIIVMIENYRTGLLWNLFTSCPEVKAGMLTLGFSAPYL